MTLTSIDDSLSVTGLPSEVEIAAFAERDIDIAGAARWLDGRGGGAA